MTTDISADQIIDALGGTSAAARLCDVRPQSVSGWRKSGIPKAQLRFIKVIRPDLFGNDRRGKRRTRTT